MCGYIYLIILFTINRSTKKVVSFQLFQQELSSMKIRFIIFYLDPFDLPCFNHTDGQG